MKKISTIFCIALLVGLTVSIVACSGESKPKIEKATDMNGKEYTSRFLCPMSCKTSGANQPGKCPACKMDYVLNEHFGHNHGAGGHGHGHGHDHSGHDHSGHNH